MTMEMAKVYESVKTSLLSPYLKSRETFETKHLEKSTEISRYPSSD